MRTIFSSILVGLALAWTPGIHAATSTVPEIQATPPEIVAEQLDLRTQMQESKGRFAEMPAVKKSSIAKNQAIVLGLLEGRETLAELTPDQKVEAANALESINASINNTEDERLVCKRNKPIGSNIVVRTCKSVAQMEADKEAGANEMRRMNLMCGDCNKN